MTCRNDVFNPSAGSLMHNGDKTLFGAVFEISGNVGSFFLAEGHNAGCLTVSTLFLLLFAKRILICWGGEGNSLTGRACLAKGPGLNPQYLHF